MDRNFSSGRLLVAVAALSFIFLTFSLLSPVFCTHPNTLKASCKCPEEMLNFTIRREFCGAELLSDSCQKNTIYACQVGNNKTHAAIEIRPCWRQWQSEAWCGLRCSSRYSYSCTPRCMDIERADQSYRKLYKFDCGSQPEYTPWGNRTPHIWIL